MNNRLFGLKSKPQVLDRLPFASEHLLIASLNVKALQSELGCVDVRCVDKVHNVFSLAKNFQGVLEQRSIVGFQAKVSTGAKDFLVHLQEARTGEPAFDVTLARPRIGEGHPDLVNFGRCKKCFQGEYVCPQESDVGKLLFDGQRTPLPYSVAFYIHTDIISSRKPGSQLHRILAASTSKFNCDRLCNREVGFIPLTLYGGVQLLAGLKHIGSFSNDFKTERLVFQASLSTGAQI